MMTIDSKSSVKNRTSVFNERWKRKLQESNLQLAREMKEQQPSLEQHRSSPTNNNVNTNILMEKENFFPPENDHHHGIRKLWPNSPQTNQSVSSITPNIDISVNSKSNTPPFAIYSNGLSSNSEDGKKHENHGSLLLDSQTKIMPEPCKDDVFDSHTGLPTIITHRENPGGTSSPHSLKKKRKKEQPRSLSMSHCVNITNDDDDDDLFSPHNRKGGFTRRSTKINDDDNDTGDFDISDDSSQNSNTIHNDIGLEAAIQKKNRLKKSQTTNLHKSKVKSMSTTNLYTSTQQTKTSKKLTMFSFPFSQKRKKTIQNEIDENRDELLFESSSLPFFSKMKKKNFLKNTPTSSDLSKGPLWSEKDGKNNSSGTNFFFGKSLSNYADFSEELKEKKASQGSSFFLKKRKNSLKCTDDLKIAISQAQLYDELVPRMRSSGLIMANIESKEDLNSTIEEETETVGSHSPNNTYLKNVLEKIHINRGQMVQFFSNGWEEIQIVEMTIFTKRFSFALIISLVCLFLAF